MQRLKVSVNLLSVLRAIKRNFKFLNEVKGHVKDVKVFQGNDRICFFFVLV